MNYIELINQFWQLRRSKRITSLQADLYMFLLQECNLKHWENPFECSNKLICASIGISEPSLIDARNRLQQLGLIKFKPGKRNETSPVYLLINLKNLSRNRDEPLVEPLDETEEKGAHYNKQNNTKPSSSVPNGTGGSKNKKSGPKKNKEKNPLYTACIARYNDFIKDRTELGAKIDKAQGAAMKTIIDYLKTQIKGKQDKEITEEELGALVQESWDIILSRHHLWTPWQQTRLKLTDINSELMNILNQIRNAATTTNNNGTGGNAGKETNARGTGQPGASLDDLDGLKRNTNAGAEEPVGFTEAEDLNG